MTVIDDREFVKAIKEFKSRLKEARKLAVATAGLQLLNDCIFLPPTCPIKTGYLRGSGSVTVNNRMYHSTKRLTGVGDPVVASGAKEAKELIESVVGFNTSYAAQTDRLPRRFREPTAGQFWFSGKCRTRAKLYGKLMAYALFEELEM